MQRITSEQLLVILQQQAVEAYAQQTKRQKLVKKYSYASLSPSCDLHRFSCMEPIAVAQSNVLPKVYNLTKQKQVSFNDDLENDYCYESFYNDIDPFEDYLIKKNAEILTKEITNEDVYDIPHVNDWAEYNDEVNPIMISKDFMLTTSKDDAIVMTLSEINDNEIHEVTNFENYNEKHSDILIDVLYRNKVYCCDTNENGDKIWRRPVIDIDFDANPKTEWIDEYYNYKTSDLCLSNRENPNLMIESTEIPGHKNPCTKNSHFFLNYHCCPDCFMAFDLAVPNTSCFDPKKLYYHREDSINPYRILFILRKLRRLFIKTTIVNEQDCMWLMQFSVRKPIFTYFDKSLIKRALLLVEFRKRSPDLIYYAQTWNPIEIFKTWYYGPIVDDDIDSELSPEEVSKRKRFTEKIYTYFEKICGNLMKSYKWLKEALTGLATKISDYICDHFVTNIFKKKTIDFIFNSALYLISGVILGCILMSVGLLTAQLFKFLFSTTLPAEAIDDLTSCYLAEGDYNHPVEVAPNFLASVFEIKGNALSRFRTLCNTVTSAYAATKIVALIIPLIIFLLPNAIIMYLKTRGYLDTQAEIELEFESWKMNAQIIFVVSKIPSIIGKEPYLNYISDTLKDCQGLLEKLKDPQKRTVLVQLWGKLLALHANELQMQNSSNSRITPYAIHIFGDPGVGKSITVDNIISSAFSFKPSDVYSRPANDPFWSGFHCQPVVVYDEFMQGSPETATNIATEYLQLVSNVPFLPAMASVDNPTVGLKGTSARPNVVITINNNGYLPCNHINIEALHRRRNLLIEARVKPNYPYYDRQSRRLDVNALSTEQIASADWLEFHLFPSVQPKDNAINTNIHMKLSLNELIVYIKDQYKQNRELSIKLTESLGVVNTNELTPEQIINSVRVQSYNAQSEELIKNLMLSFRAYKNEPEVRPEDKQAYHTHYCCGLAHLCDNPRGTTRVFVCKYCHTAEMCSILMPLSFLSAHDKTALLTPTSNYIECGSTEPNVEVIMRNKALVAAGIKNKTGSHEHKCCDITYQCHITPAYGIKGHCIECKTQFKDKFCHFFNGIKIEDNTGFESTATDKPFQEECQEIIANNYFTAHSRSLSEAMWNLRTHKTQLSAKQIFYVDLPLQAHEMAISEETLLEHKIETARGFRFDEYQIKVTSDEETAYNNMNTSTKIALKAMGIYSIGLLSGVALVKIFQKICKLTKTLFDRPLTKEDSDLFYEAQYVNSPGNKYADAKPNTKNINKKHKFQKFNNYQNYLTQGVNIVGTHFYLDNLKINAVVVYGNYFLTYAHAFKDVDKSSVIRFTNNNVTYTESFDPENIVTMVDRDIALLRISGSCLMRTHEKKFLTDEQISSLTSTSGYLERLSGNTNCFISRTENFPYMLNTKRITIPECYKYSVNTVAGDCGSLLFASGGFLTNKILGIHVAGSPRPEKGYGAATIVTREMIDVLKSGFELVIEDVDEVALSQGYTLQELSSFPNVTNVKYVKDNEYVRIPNHTKIKKSVLYGMSGDNVDYEPAILSVNDPRSKGVCPVQNGITRIANIESKKIDENIVDICADMMYESWDKHMECKFQPRLLTFEEACFGIPGLMNGVDVSTSPGFPLICEQRKKKGKKDYIDYIDDENGIDVKCFTDPLFKERVYTRVEEMINYDGDEIDNRFICYLKDETVRKEKITNVTTRMIFSNDLISLIAFKIMFGSTVIRIMNSYNISPSIINNPSSYDMQHLYEYLSSVGNKFMDGDYKSWDITMHPYFMLKAYHIFGRFSVQALGNSINYLIKHECKGWLQFQKLLIKFHSLQFSGNYLVTIINCMVNELYFRVSFFILDQSLNFDKNVRLKVLGDDNIYCVSDKVIITPVDIANVMSTFGVLYTSADKDSPLSLEYKRFEDCQFLGCSPVKIYGFYSGALVKKTLMNSLQWTKNNNVTIYEHILQMQEFASQWDQDFYIYYNNLINTYLVKNNFEPVDVPLYLAKRIEVANRNTRKLNIAVAQSQQLTTISIEDEITMANMMVKTRDVSAKYTKSINADPFDMHIGLNSDVWRTDFEWPISIEGKIQSYSLPLDLLALGNQQNLQNIAFKRLIYFHTDIDITILINGNTFSNGCLVATFIPLVAKSQIPSNIKQNILCNNHVMLFPNINTTAKIHIPFLHYKSALNTLAVEKNLENLGVLLFYVLTPLVNPAGSPVTISVFTKFPNAEFTFPRPLDDVSYVAQGNSASTESNTYIYNTNSIVGPIPVENALSTGAEQSIGTDLGLEIPLDNPPMSSCSIPTHQVYSGLSKTIGVEPTVSMQFHPQTMFREPFKMRDNDESRLESIMNRKSLISTFVWSSTDTTGKLLTTLNLNSSFDFMPFSQTPLLIPVPIAILNFFDFWRADLEFELIIPKTVYHSGRLLVAIGYGVANLVAADRGLYVSHVLDFSKDNMSAKWTVPFSACTEYLRTFSGANYTDALQNFSLGQMSIFINNNLQCSSEVVASSLSCNLFLSMKNIQVAEYKTQTFIDKTNIVINDIAIAQGVITADIQEPDTGNEDLKTTAENTIVQSAPVCKLEIGRKFEYVIRDIHEVIRRPVLIKYNEVKNYLQASGLYTTVAFIKNYPRHAFRRYFRLWSGHLKYRILCNTVGITKVYYIYDAPDDVLGDVDYASYAARAGVISNYDGQSFTCRTTMSPVEIMYSTSAVSQYIDINVPFNSHYNAITNSTQDDFINAPFCGVIMVVFETGISSNRETDQVFQSYGDDGRLFVPAFLTATYQSIGGNTLTYPNGAGGYFGY